LTSKRTIKILLASVWALLVITLLGFAIKLLQDFVSTPEQAAAPPAVIQPPPKPEKREVILYFSDADASSLLQEKRSISLGAGIQSDAAGIANELIRGPQLENLSPTIPPDTRLINAYFIGDTLVLDFSQELQKNHTGGSAGELTTIYSIVNSMTENLRGVKKVQILVEGLEIETLAGHLDLSRPLHPDVKWMKKLPRTNSTS